MAATAVLTLLCAPLAWAGFTGWANIQGANYVPSYVHKDVHDIFTPAKWNATTVNRELGWTKSLAVNSLRVFVTYGAYLDGNQPEVFIQNYKTFQHMMKEHNLSLLVTMAGHSNDCDNATKFINTVVEAEVPTVVIGYEADNEPAPYHLDYVTSCLLPALLKANRNPNVDSSVGFAHVGQAAGLAANVTSINWHSYNGQGNGEGLLGEIKWLQSVANKYTPPKPVVLTEWHARPDQPLAGAYPVIKDHNVAAYLWALVICNNCVSHYDRPVAVGDPPFQGIFWPNGTAYDDLEEGECMRTQCKALTYVHHCCNMKSKPEDDALFNFSSDWVIDADFGSPVYNHAWGPREGSVRQTNKSGAAVTIGPLPKGTKRVALYLPQHETGAEYTVNLDGKQVYAGSTLVSQKESRNWVARIVLPVPNGAQMLELIVNAAAPSTMQFKISGATFFFTNGPTPTPAPPPTPTPPAPPPTPVPTPQCTSQTDVIIGFGQLADIEKATDASECCLRCASTPNCTCWTFKTPDEPTGALDCVLKSASQCSGTKPKEHRVSGKLPSASSMSAVVV